VQVIIDNSQEKISLNDNITSLIEKVAAECLIVEDRPLDYEISVTFVDDEEIRVLNNEHRNINKSTDVLSFPIGDDYNYDIPYTPLLGDIVISIETAQRQANDFGHSIEREIAYLTAHSMFHLLGYDHIDDKDKEVMREKEKLVMKRLGIFRR